MHIPTNTNSSIERKLIIKMIDSLGCIKLHNLQNFALKLNFILKCCMQLCTACNSLVCLYCLNYEGVFVEFQNLEKQF